MMPLTNLRMLPSGMNEGNTGMVLRLLMKGIVTPD
jgi:hypothetical protein